MEAMSAKSYIGRDAVLENGWLAAHKWLLIRRIVQLGILGLFLAGPLADVWIVKGNLTSSLTLDVLPLSDPFILLQSLFAGHVAASSAVLGAAIVVAFYLLVGGRVYCSFVCPVNIVTDTARWLAKRFALPKGWQPSRQTRLWVMGSVLVTAMVSGVMAWEMLNPVTIIHRGLVYDFGYVWTVVLALFLFDLVVSRRGWCGHLCPMGAFYGVLGVFSMTRISATQRAACNDCMDCFAVCPEPHVITPALRGAGTKTGPVILSGDCTNCARCIDVCAKNVFQFDLRFNNFAPASEGDGRDEMVSTNRHAA
ncbi:MAG: quinol dehydrogenase ferredoxin subunit NapH [Magnetovibrio sp.]|nr:quinol dehydrogenase ferredoxin subunit NapH [Magnetovibrio sp.]